MKAWRLRQAPLPKWLMRALTGAVLSALLIPIVACGAAPGSGSGKGPQTINIGRDRTLTYMVAYLAESLGYLDDAGKQVGSKVQVVPFDSSSQSLPALAGGKIDFDIQLAQNAARARLQGQNLYIAATLSDAGVGALVVNNSIQKPQDMVGKSVAFTGPATAAYPLLQAALKKDGVDPASVKFVTISDQTAFLDALRTHQVDAILPGEPVISQAVATGEAHVMYDFFNRQFVDQIMGGPYVSITLMSSDKFKTQYPDATRAIVQAHAKAIQWLRDNQNSPDTVLSKLPSEYANLKPVFPSVLQRVVEALPSTLATSEQGMQTVVNIDREQGAIKPDQQVKISDLFDNSFVQSSGAGTPVAK